MAGLRYGALRCRAAARIRTALDKTIVSQNHLKHGVLLGLVAREHIFVEGPPGCGKTLAAELGASASGLSSYFYQLHRDTRVSELVGDAVIHRSLIPGSGCDALESAARSEVLRLKNVPGGVLTAQVCILDDITRAPGEALNVLLRVLAERKFGSEQLPLVSAIATANPPGEQYYVDPMDPATLDRFAVQLRVKGLVGQHDWPSVDAVIKAPNHAWEAPTTGTDKSQLITELEAAQAEAASVNILPRVQRLLLRLMQVLWDMPGVGGDKHALSDRAFLVKSLKLMQAQAHVMGRQATYPDDLHVLALMTTFRVPPEIHADMAAIIQQVIDEDEANRPTPPPPPLAEEEEEENPPPPNGDDGGGGEEMEDDDGTEPNDSSKIDMPESDDEEEDDRPDVESSTGTPPSMDNPEELNAGGESSSTDQSREASEDSESSLPSVQSIVDQATRGEGEEEDGAVGVEATATQCDNVEAVLRVLKGRIERGKAQATPHRGGQPRSYYRPDDFDDFDDADPIEVLEWLRNPTPQLPRRLHRMRTDRSGSLALLRDTSMSMTGVWTEWAQSLALQIVTLGREQSMRIGYMEFNHLLKKVVAEDDAFFVRDYDLLVKEIASAKCSGVTNYQLPLSNVLAEFRVSQSRKHDRHILFLTDGLPTSGCKRLIDETAMAVELGVSVHTLFIGSKPYPEILQRLSESTRGVQFRAAYDHLLKSIVVTQRKPGDH